MTDQERWDLGVAAVEKEYRGLSEALRERVRGIAAAIRSGKETMQRIVADAGGADACAGCGGECCKGGKNHVRAVDLVIHLNDGLRIFTPRFDRDICPYLGEDGCLMGGELRPFNCIAFICEEVEWVLTEAEKGRFYAAERELRSLYRELEEIFDRRFRRDLLSVG